MRLVLFLLPLQLSSSSSSPPESHTRLLHIAMASTHAVCSMCGDIGFPDKLFRCSRCRSRFQHSYCTNFYHELPAGSAGVCDWCLSEGRIGDKYELPWKKSEGRDSAEAAGRRTAYAKGDKVKQSGRGDDSDSRGSSGSSTSSSKPAGRRYKLLKDVLC